MIVAVAEINTAPPTQPRRALRYSLRALLTVVSLLCIWLAVIAGRAHRQERAMDTVERLGGYVQFDYGGVGEFPAAGGKGSIEIDNFTIRENKGELPGVIWPRWLRRLLGEEYFRTVTMVNVGRRKPSDGDLKLLDALPDLTGVFLFQNSTIGDEGLAHVAQLKNLVQLDFCGTSVTDQGMASIAGLTNLKELWMFEVPGVTDAGMKYVSGLHELKLLDVRRTPQLTDAMLPYLAGLTKLEDLELGGTGITDDGMRYLSGLVNLRQLSLQETNIQGPGLRDLAELPMLTDLYLDGAIRLGDDDIANLRHLPRLTKLGLSKSGVTDNGLAVLVHLPMLKQLSLMGNQITDAGVEQLAALKSLEWLSLADTQITDIGLKRLASFDSLKELTLPAGTTTKAGIAELQRALPGCKINTY